ncbi:hypothetical protein [Parabacteroides distasonis]|uniref:hypothetical protein n=2 Tax=Parabacteroides distasonis TaxID=823 RepID=UPI001E5A02AC|nr:hypothetical protein [Parabacteroides distasonis]MDB9152127.1 hypothetical protein [Parabacteroides distasonis]MDB9156682.1 hypothetical protein [Parabacteroides distasonis]MDB9165808.1 hypothetical protein [Parabacteroides distasonis]MDB9170215.1 hypothetical protein [Parabacteroides distasonis]MDB9196488.1 hypothetical protein [Parabacteroides distasonis]
MPQLPVRLNERSVVLNTSTGALKGKMVTPNQESGYPVVFLKDGKPVPDVPIGLQARPSADYHLIGNMNHLMKACDTMDQQKQMATYTDPALPLHKDVLILIEKFVSKP